MSIITRVARLRTQNFTASGTFTVPNDVYSIIVNGTGGGGGYASGSTNVAFASGGSGGFTQNFKIPVTPGETLTITIGAAGTAGTAGGSTIIFSSATSSNLLVLGGGGAPVTYANGSQGGNGGFPNGSGGFAQTKSTGTILASGGSGKGTSSGLGQSAQVASFKLPGMGKFQSGAKSRGITPFMYGRGGRHDGTTPSVASAGFLIISWVE